MAEAAKALEADKDARIAKLEASLSKLEKKHNQPARDAAVKIEADAKQKRKVFREEDLKDGGTTQKKKSEPKEGGGAKKEKKCCWSQPSKTSTMLTTTSNKLKNWQRVTLLQPATNHLQHQKRSSNDCDEVEAKPDPCFQPFTRAVKSSQSKTQTSKKNSHSHTSVLQQPMWKAPPQSPPPGNQSANGDQGNNQSAEGNKPSLTTATPTEQGNQAPTDPVTAAAAQVPQIVPAAKAQEATKVVAQPESACHTSMGPGAMDMQKLQCQISAANHPNQYCHPMHSLVL